MKVLFHLGDSCTAAVENRYPANECIASDDQLQKFLSIDINSGTSKKVMTIDIN